MRRRFLHVDLRAISRRAGLLCGAVGGALFVATGAFVPRAAQAADSGAVDCPACGNVVLYRVVRPRPTVTAFVYSLTGARGRLVAEGSSAVPPRPRGPRAARLYSPSRSAALDDVILRVARGYRVEPSLVKAVIAAESAFDPGAVSPRGAQGLMQLMPETARDLGVSRPFAVEDNVDGGVRYLRRMLDRYGATDHALAAYNAGPGAVDAHGGIPPYRETQQYIQRVRALHRSYQHEFSR